MQNHCNSCAQFKSYVMHLMMSPPTYILVMSTCCPHWFHRDPQVVVAPCPPGTPPESAKSPKNSL